MSGSLGRFGRLALFLLGLGSLLQVGRAAEAEQMKLADRVVAIVNNEIVTDFEFRQALLADEKYQSLLASSASIERARALARRRRYVLEKLVQRRLLVSEAKRLGIVADQEAIERQIEKARKRAGASSEEDFKRLLRKEGLTLETFKALLAEEYLAQTVLDANVRSGIEVTDAQILRYYEAHKAQLRPAESASFAQILFRVKDFSDAEAVESARRRAQEALKSIRNGKSFEEVCVSIKNAVTSCSGLGFLRRGEMLPEVADAVFALQPGQVSGVVKSSMGFHIFKLLDKEGRGHLGSRLKERIRQMLYAEEFEKRYDEFISRLKAKSYIKTMLNAPGPVSEEDQHR